MWVVTVDQRDSRILGDRVDGLVAGLPVVAGVVRPAERTVGDELQLVLDDARGTVDLVLHLLRLGGWSVGVGAGPVDQPLPANLYSPPAFTSHRSALMLVSMRDQPAPAFRRKLSDTK